MSVSVSLVCSKKSVGGPNSEVQNFAWVPRWGRGVKPLRRRAAAPICYFEGLQDEAERIFHTAEPLGAKHKHKVNSHFRRPLVSPATTPRPLAALPQILTTNLSLPESGWLRW